MIPRFNAPVRIHIRSRRDRSRYMGRRGWTISARWAQRFPSAQAAIHFCLENDIEDAEVTVDFRVVSAAVIVVRVPSELPAEPGAFAEWLLAEGI